MEIYKVIYMSISIQKCDLYLRLRSKKTQHSEMKEQAKKKFPREKKTRDSRHKGTTFIQLCSEAKRMV